MSARPRHDQLSNPENLKLHFQFFSLFDLTSNSDFTASVHILSEMAFVNNELISYTHVGIAERCQDDSQILNF